MDSWYDTSDPLGRNVVGANYAVFGAHLDEIENPACFGTRNKPQAIVLMGATNTISTGDYATGIAPAKADYCKMRVECTFSAAAMPAFPSF